MVEEVEEKGNNNVQDKSSDENLRNELNNVSAPNEERNVDRTAADQRLLTDLINSQIDLADFTPEQLEKISALASTYPNIPGAGELKAKIEAQRKTEETTNNETANENEQPKNDDRGNADIPCIDEPTYNLYKKYSELKNKEQPSEEDKAMLATIKEQVNTILDNTDVEGITPESAVDLKDYLEISALSNPDAAKQERNQKISAVVDEKLSEYDSENAAYISAYASHTEEQLAKNKGKWLETTLKEDVIASELKSVLANLPENEQRDVYKTIMDIALEKLKVIDPQENTSETAVKENSETYSSVIKDRAAEFKSMVSAEYLKQTAVAEFCEENNVSAEDLNNIMERIQKNKEISEEDKKLYKNFENYANNYVSKFPNFNGPYDDKEALQRSVINAEADMISRQATLSSRVARLTNAPEISRSVAKINNNFAAKHPTVYTAFNVAKKFGLSMAKTAAIGAVFGPVGLGAYSGYKTFQAMRKSYKQYKEANEGGNWKGWLKHLVKNPKEGLTLAGQIAGSAISIGFGINGELGDMAARRIAQATVSLTVGVSKATVAKLSQRDAKRGLEKILRSHGANLDKKDLKKLIGMKDPEQFTKIVSALAPNISQEQMAAALDFAQKYQKEKPLREGLGNVAAAAGGLFAHEIAENNLFNINGLIHQSGSENIDHDNISESAKTGSMQKIIDEHQPTPEDLSEKAWNADGAEANRELAANCNPAGLNEKLRELGVISEDDKHFYVSRELKDMLNKENLTAEQKTGIQEFANNREGNLAAMRAYNEAHAHVTENVSAHHTAVATETHAQALTEEEVKGQINTETPQNKTGNVFTLTPVKTTTETQTVTEMNVVQERLHYVRGKMNGTDISEKVKAGNPVEAANAVNKEHGYDESSSKAKYEITNEEGKTKISMRDTKDARKTEITSYDAQGHKISKQHFELNKETGERNTEFHGDVNGDGKKDTIESTSDGDNKVTYTNIKGKGGNDSLVYESKENGKNTITVEDLTKRGYSQSEAEYKIKEMYDSISKKMKDNNAALFAAAKAAKER